MLVSGPTVLVINLTVRVVSHRQAAMAWFSFLFLSAGDGLKAEGSTTHLPDVYRWGQVAFFSRHYCESTIDPRNVLLLLLLL